MRSGSTARDAGGAESGYFQRRSIMLKGRRAIDAPLLRTVERPMWLASALRRKYATAARRRSRQLPPAATSPRPHSPAAAKPGSQDRDPPAPPLPYVAATPRNHHVTTEEPARSEERLDPRRAEAAARRVVTTGVLDRRYKRAAWQVTKLIVALPLVIGLGWELAQRKFMGKEQKVPPMPTPPQGHGAGGSGTEN